MRTTFFIGPCLFPEQKGGDQVDEVIDMLDKDADGSLDFQEYFTLVAGLATSVHTALENH